MLIYFFDVIEGKIVFVVSVKFFEDGCDFFFCLVSKRFGVHGLHELNETDSTCFFCVEFGNDLIGGFPVRFETILSEEELKVVGEKYSHACGIIWVQYFFEVYYILIGEIACHI